MKYYDLTYLISPRLANKEANDLSQKIIATIQQEGGLLDKIEMPFKVALEYPIAKEKTAWLSFLTFFLEPDKEKELHSKLGLENNILRSLCFVKKPPRLRPKETKPKIPRKIAEKKVGLKEIEKKLEEILSEP